MLEEPGERRRLAHHLLERAGPARHARAREVELGLDARRLDRDLLERHEGRLRALVAVDEVGGLHALVHVLPRLDEERLAEALDGREEHLLEVGEAGGEDGGRHDRLEPPLELVEERVRVGEERASLPPRRRSRRARERRGVHALARERGDERRVGEEGVPHDLLLGHVGLGAADVGVDVDRARGSRQGLAEHPRLARRVERRDRLVLSREDARPHGPEHLEGSVGADLDAAPGPAHDLAVEREPDEHERSPGRVDASAHGEDPPVHRVGAEDEVEPPVLGDGVGSREGDEEQEGEGETPEISRHPSPYG